MGMTTMGAAVSLDGFIAAEDDSVGPLFDWYSNGEVTWTYSDTEREFHTTQVTADFEARHNKDVAAVVIGRHLFDLTNGWDGRPAAGDHVFVVTHSEPTDWEFYGTAPFTFVNGVREAVAQAQEFAGDRDISVTAGDIGGQALRAGLIDRLVLNVVPVVFGAGKPCYGTGSVAVPILFDNPAEIVQGDRVTHLVYDLARAS